MPLPFSRRALQTAPSFSRDFAGLKTLDHGVGPAITFTRADATTCATYFDAGGVLRTAAANVPRFDHDPATGASRGLLIEEARTNLFQRSAEFDNAYWGKNEASVTANAETSPDGTSSGDKLIESANNDVHWVRSALFSATSETRSLSVFAKKGERNRLAVAIWNGSTSTRSANALFDLNAGTVLYTYSAGSWTSVSSSITPVGNGWYRCVVTATGDGTNGYYGYLTVGNDTQSAATASTGTTAYTGDGTSGLFIWGAQLEAGAFATSYIPTTSAAATRSADSAVVTPISSFYNQAEGTLFAELQAQTLTQSGGFARRVVTLDNNTTDDEVNISQSGTADQLSFIVRQSAAASAVIVGGSSITSITKAIGAYATNNAQASYNGTLGTADTSVTVPTTLTHLKLGRSTSSTARLFQGHIRKVAYWPKRLTNTLLEQLTT
jgi:hypothetical protein